jgi:hydroxymethylbilane synthase
MSARAIVFGSRPSQLARWQTDFVIGKLRAAWPELDFRVDLLVTEGDRRLDRPLPEIGGKGVFTEEIEAALGDGRIDLAVHSLKDLPIEAARDLCVGAVSARADARDVLVSASGVGLAELAGGARVGTSSLRRQAQLLAVRPDLKVQPLRGNVDTRLRKALQGEYDAILLAAAGLERLGLGDRATEYLPFEAMLPAPGQGALAVQCRAGDVDLLARLRPLHDEAAFRAVTAERAFLAGLGGGCSAPVAAYAEDTGGHLELRGLVASPDGMRVIRVRGRGSDAERLGWKMAREAIDKGAGEVLGGTFPGSNGGPNPPAPFP